MGDMCAPFLGHLGRLADAAEEQPLVCIIDDAQ
jgi:hypothetical protein